MSDALRPMDVILSYKRIPQAWWPVKDAWWWPPTRPFEVVADASILKYGRKLYPNGDIRYNHVRLYLGAAEDIPLIFEFTFPAARIARLEPWMIQAPYGNVFRYTGPCHRLPVPGLLATCLPYIGTLYDLGQLVDIGLGRRIFDFGKDNMVCSVGVRKIIETIVGVPELFPNVALDRTPPCSFANSPHFLRVN